MNQYNLDSLLSNHFRALFIGASGSGKSFFICHKIIPVLLDKYDVFIVITPLYNSTVYTKHLPKEGTRVIDSTQFTDSKGLEQTLKNIEFMLQGWKKKGVKNIDGHALYKFTTCIIMDDVLSEKFSKSEEMMNLFMRMRHYQCSIIMTANTTTRIISPAMYANTSHICFFKMYGKGRNDSLNQLLQYVDSKGTEKKIKKEVDDIYTKYVDQKKYGALLISCEDSKIYTN
jgi:hypothetical protein